MAKVPISRLNSAPLEYRQNDFNQLIEDLQDMVDGYIEILASRDGEKQIIVDEEGLLKGKQPNIEASDEAKRVIFGDAVILSGSARID